jgi:hypothetical protein
MLKRASTKLLSNPADFFEIGFVTGRKPAIAAGYKAGTQCVVTHWKADVTFDRRNISQNDRAQFRGVAVVTIPMGRRMDSVQRNVERKLRLHRVDPGRESTPADA